MLPGGVGAIVAPGAVGSGIGPVMVMKWVKRLYTYVLFLGRPYYKKLLLLCKKYAMI